MKLKKLLKVYDKDSYIIVRDSSTVIISQSMTVSEFKKFYGKDILKRKVMYFDVSGDKPYTIVIDI